MTELEKENWQAAQREYNQEVERARKDKETLFRVGLPVIASRTNFSLCDGTKRELEIYGSSYKGFNFEKAYKRWYWIVHGKMPLEAANELYAFPIGKSDIRSGGDCGMREPRTWATFVTPLGKEVIDVKQWNEIKAAAERPDAGKFSIDLWQKVQEDSVPSDEPETIAKGYVYNYHIDSELGLYIFKQTLDRIFP